MIRRQDPTNDQKRLDQLRNITEHPNLTNRNGERLITEERIRETTEIADRLGEAIRTRKRARTARSGISRELNRKMAELITYIRFLWNNLDGTIRVGRLDQTRYTEFGLTLEGRRPNPTSHRDWLMIAEEIIREAATEIGGIDREELTTLFEEATTLVLETGKAENELRDRQGTLKRVREEADTHIRKTASQLKAVLYEEDPPTRRRTMRALGFRFEGDRRDIGETTSIETD